MARLAATPAGRYDTVKTQLICILGAECTGKTTLAGLLAQTLDCPWVPEYLRSFCDAQGRTPRAAEQAGILEKQYQQEEAARLRASVQGQPYVFCDTAPLLTAIYSDYVFGDTTLLPRGRELHARYRLTLLLEPDIAWVADGLQRDGAHVREPVQRMLEAALAQAGGAVARVTGNGPERLQSALQALKKQGE